MIDVMRNAKLNSRSAAKEASHERIVSVAARAIRRSGYDGTGVADIMKEAGLTHGAFYAHFPSREAMLAEAADRACAESAAAAADVVASVPPERALESMLHVYLSREHLEQVETGCPLAALGSETPRQAPEVRRAATRHIKAMIDLVARQSPDWGQPGARTSTRDHGHHGGRFAAGSCSRRARSVGPPARSCAEAVAPYQYLNPTDGCHLNCSSLHMINIIRKGVYANLGATLKRYAPCLPTSSRTGNPIIEKGIRMSSIIAKPPLAGQATSTVGAMAILRLKQMGAVGLILVAALTTLPVLAGDASPSGLWKNLDDVSGKPRALIRITESNGTLQGKIEKAFPGPTEDQNPRCHKCEGTNKDAPVVGLVILSGLTKEGDEYVGGQILDPDNGKVYRSKVRLIDDGKKLSVRGYIGVPMLGRSQTWVRQE